MTDQSQYEKYEKEEKSRSQDEKEEEKQYEKHQPEKQQHEKRWDEKRQRDPIGALTWPIVLIWAGVVFLLDNLGVLRNIGDLEHIDPWSLILAGAGGIILVMVIIRYLMPEYRRPLTGNIILGFFLLGIGLSDILGWEIIWAIIIIAIGVTLLLRGLGRRR
jgi:hypothetical protein